MRSTSNDSIKQQKHHYEFLPSIKIELFYDKIKLMRVRFTATIQGEAYPFLLLAMSLFNLPRQ
ncbi:MAG: hypothetical protein HRU09_03185 [Oligoflexales bacterium]|nr:hypothetical protein [Oligoflexales bacterium]